MILMFAFLPIQRAVLSRAFNTTGRGLLDVDVCSIIFGILLYAQRNGREANGFPCPPSDALEGEDWVGVVRECFVLLAGSIEA